ncbi:MAG: YfhO family protein [Acidobacteriota bacterium]
MRTPWPEGVAALPGLLLAAVSLTGIAPNARDLPTYFEPLRLRAAEVLTEGRSPWWSPDTGGGEPFFANPQTGILYPPAWLAAVMPAGNALGIEAGLHLALLGAGVCWLARRLGARNFLGVAGGLAATLAGPVAGSAGVLNNLDTLAWLPWLWGAAHLGALPAVALCGAAAWLGGEPQLAAVGWALAIMLAPRRRTLGGLAIAAGLVATQAVPFASWVAGGDRGPGAAIEEVAGGALKPREWPSLAFEREADPVGEDRFVVHPTLALWVLVLGAVAAMDRRPPVRRMAIAGWVLIGVALVAGLDWGQEVWATVTLGLVRFPTRLLLPAAILIAPAAAAAAGTRVVSPGKAVGLALGLAAAGIAVHAPLPGAVVAGLTAGLALAPPLAAPAAVVGALALAPMAVAALDLERHAAAATPCLDAQVAGARVYAVAPSAAQLQWVAGKAERARALGLGYTPLLDGRRHVRSFGPVISRPLSEHLAQADRGPAFRWWLDALGADRVVAHHPLVGFEELCREGGLHVAVNSQAWPVVSLVAQLPRPGLPPQAAGLLENGTERDDSAEWRVHAPAGGAVLMRLVNPDDGWRWTVDGRRVTVERGEGIVHGVRVPPGRHHVRARYRPPGLVAGAAVSTLSLVVLVVAWRRRW